MSEIQTKVWAIPQLPLDWVVEREGKLWIVPAAANGWNRRKPYKGHHPEKIPSASQAAFYMLISTGIPLPNAPDAGALSNLTSSRL